MWKIFKFTLFQVFSVVEQWKDFLSKVVFSSRTLYKIDHGFIFRHSFRIFWSSHLHVFELFRRFWKNIINVQPIKFLQFHLAQTTYSQFVKENKNPQNPRHSHLLISLNNACFLKKKNLTQIRFISYQYTFKTNYPYNMLQLGCFLSWFEFFGTSSKGRNRNRICFPESLKEKIKKK